MEPAYVVNTKTRVVYAYSKDLMMSEDPKFVPYEGKDLPPIDFETGMRLAPKNTDEFINLRRSDADLTPEERIERLAAVVHLVDKEDVSESGHPSAIAMERLSGLEDVKRAEVTKALKLRKDKISGKLRPAEEEGAGEGADA